MAGWGWCMMAVMAGDLLIPYLLAPFYRGYRHRDMVMSLLGNPRSPVRRVYNCWLVAGGLAFVWGSCMLYRNFGGGDRLSAVLLALMLGYALGGMVLSGLFSVGQTKEMTTLPARIHGYGSMLGFVMLLFVPLLLALWAGKRGGAGGAVLCGVSFALAFLTFVLFVMADKPRFRGTVIGQEGLWQRLTLFFMYCPIGYFCIAL